MPTVELRFAALPGHVRTARMIATAVSRRAGVPVGAIDEIKLAVGEACARAVRVNRRSNPQAFVHVELTDTPESFRVVVSDSGAAGDEIAPGPDGGLLSVDALLDLGEGAEPDLAAIGVPDTEVDQPLPSGLGLALIEGLVDEVAVRRGQDGTGTVVEMTWHTAEPEEDADLDSAGYAALAAQIAGSARREG
ncbi:Anti-sigma regulatory factor (Ser/Thr protein kinase) [Parafrankia irregularis]|uniref:Anti-sigma regulatory factor (Ser/Thr protein kinase) n=1 Tax=Parafrankia irregularis TaxID=795642 RepID=A0A0S4QS06_9ACTN|nr:MULTISPECIES: ATP-binding protein [Parafrankia]MBE3204555.1 ATP-binding protein [Parafrankia sp. CH37]CUU58405.1 Anti-sigma regulatory factor (Ser/Thr protein kinase) [Parafrankia irregularis]